MKAIILKKLQNGNLQEAYDISKALGMRGLSNDIAELIYCRDEDYNLLLKWIIKTL